MGPHTLNHSREISMFNPETVWREVFNDDIWRIRDGENIQDYRERILRIRQELLMCAMT
jgi:hypothetical protein